MRKMIKINLYCEMFTVSSSQYKRVQFHLHLCNFCCCTCKEFRKTKEFYVSISLLWYQLVKKRLWIYQFYILSIRFQIWKKICSKIFRRMKVQNNQIQEIVVRFDTFFVLDHVTIVYTKKTVEGDRLVRVDVTLTAVSKMLLRELQSFLLYFQFCSIKP